MTNNITPLPLLHFTLLPFDACQDEGVINASEHPLIAVLGADLNSDGISTSYSKSFYQQDEDTKLVALLYNNGNQEWGTTNIIQATTRLALHEMDAIKFLGKKRYEQYKKSGKSFETPYEYCDSTAIADKEKNAQLERQFNENKLTISQKPCTLYNNKNAKLEANTVVIDDNGDKWVRIIGRPHGANSKIKIDNQTKRVKKVAYYFKVNKVRMHIRKDGYCVLENVCFVGPLSNSLTDCFYDRSLKKLWISQAPFQIVAIEMLPDKQYLREMKRIRKKEHKEILKNPTFGQTSLDEMEAAGTITINASKKTPIKIGKSRFILDSYAPYDDVNIRV